MTSHPEEVYTALLKSDSQLKSLPVDKYAKLATDQQIQTVTKALESKKWKVVVCDDGKQALEWLKSNIPSGSTVMNGHSTTLEEIGFIEHLKTQKAWKNLHENILSESDMAKRAALYKEAHQAQYFFTSATAISEQGDITAADLTGTKTGAFSYAAGHLVVVCGTNKIVPSFSDAVKRTEEYCLPLESARARIAYNVPGSQMTNFVALRGANPFDPAPRVTVVFIKQVLGY